MPRNIEYFYAVIKGTTPGIYKACSKKEFDEKLRGLVDKYSRNVYKRFSTLSEALEFAKQHQMESVCLFHLRDNMLVPMKFFELKDGVYVATDLLNDDKDVPSDSTVSNADVVADEIFNADMVADEFSNADVAEDDVSIPDEADKSDDAVILTNDAVTIEYTSAVSEEDDTKTLIRLLTTRMDQLESENAKLKRKVEDLEEQLKSSVKGDEKDKIVKKLKLVTDASKVVLEELEVKERVINVQTKQIKEIRSEVASIKKGVKGVGPESKGGEVSANKEGAPWVEVVRRGRKRGGNRGKGRFKQNFEFLSDSHGRGLVNLLSGAEVHFKPGATMERVVEGAERKGGSCTVVMGGTNDVSVEGVRRGLFKLRERVGEGRRVIIVGVPHRYDEPYPNVEKLIKRKNELLKDFCNHYNYKFLSVDDSRKSFFTNHGLHFNMTGKRWLAKKIQTAVDFL